MDMFSRTITGSLVLLTLVLFLLANGFTLVAAGPTQLIPPPIVTPDERFGPITGEPFQVLTPTATATATLAVIDTPVITPTSTLIPETLIASTTIVATPSLTVASTPPIRNAGALGLLPPSVIVLPTITPTPLPVQILLPTPTVTPYAVLMPTDTPPPTSTPLAEVTPSVAVTPTEIAGLLPTATATTGKPELPTEALTTTLAAMPSPIATSSAAMLASYQAQGSFSSQTVYTDSTISRQWGNFSIAQSAAVNAYGANQHYTLSSQLAGGDKDDINVYQVDDYIAVNYTGGTWMVVRRDQGSNIVRAIQPINDLAVLFPRILDQAKFVGQEQIAGVPAMHYRIDDPNGQGARLIQPLLALTGQIHSLKLEVWIAVPGGYVVSYNFQVALSDARVLDANNNGVHADQTVVWTYQLTPNKTPQPIGWPAGAPDPKVIPVPGFDPGAFPMPPNTQLLSLVDGMPDLVSTQSAVQVDSYYRAELYKLGWNVMGDAGLLRCSKEGTNFQLLISEDGAAGGTRISILAGQ